jgi:Beta-glucosidase-related glycosidases
MAQDLLGQLMTGDFDTVINALTPEEKIKLLAGRYMWKTANIERLGLPSVTMTDGTYGVRYSTDQIDSDQPGGQDFAAFLSVVNQTSDGVVMAFGSLKEATCFPNGCSLACSWDTGLFEEVGQALGRECNEYGVALLLGPGINIRRTPLGGRSYEYYSEDPLLTGDLAAAMINGLQGEGVGASLKHFACNNSEVERTTMDSVVSIRALQEIYLKGFGRAIAKSDPWTVMSSYNLLNGVQAAEDPWLLTEVLREDWGYAGLVVSDWHGIKDRPAALRAGNDLDMPESETRKADLLAALEAGEVTMDQIDLSLRRVLDFLRKALGNRRRGQVTFDRDAHHALARRAAAESLVLLKNTGVLPLEASKMKRVVIFGAAACEPVIQGSGCATTLPSSLDIPDQELRSYLGPDAEVEVFMAFDNGDTAQIEAIQQADAVLYFASTEVGYDGEGSDRRNLALAPGQDEEIAALAKRTPHTVVILSNPDAVTMLWHKDVGAIVEAFFGGQGVGGAIADVLFGATNPSGKLTTTFPERQGDIPGILTYPGAFGKHLYSEDIFVGYRGYDARDIAPLFPFGFGLSYTEFTYANLTCAQSTLGPDDDLSVSFDLTNVGARAGKEVVQLYISRRGNRLETPPLELKAFDKIALEPGETRRVSLTVPAQDMRLFDTDRNAWIFDKGEITVHLGGSSRDLPLAQSLPCLGSTAPYARIRRDTQPIYALEAPAAREIFRAHLVARLAIDEEEADRMIGHCDNSFIGLFTTFDRRFRLKFTEAEIADLLTRMNAAIEA